MCSGSITKYSCGHESRKYYFKCPDGKNKYYEELLPHRLVGRRFKSHRLCNACEEVYHLGEVSDRSAIERHEENAKALLEYYRGERTYPVPDTGLGQYLPMLYFRGDRLHPFLNRGQEVMLEVYRTEIERRFQGTTITNPSSQNEGARLFQEMLDRQAEIDRTGRSICPDDRELMLSRLQILAAERSAAAQEREQARRQEAIRQPEEEGFRGLYQSDPEWLLNFDDWCTENSLTTGPDTEVELRRDINGWYQHLRSCESRLRLSWITYAECYRAGYDAGTRRRFDFIPLFGDSHGDASSFQSWCTGHTTLRDITTLAPNSLFIRNLERYEEYLEANGWLEDRQCFRFERQELLERTREAFSRIPGAPLSHQPVRGGTHNAARLLRRICSDMPTFPNERGSVLDHDRRLSVMGRFQDLTLEALDVREGRISEFRIERQEVVEPEPENVVQGGCEFPVGCGVH